jgi:hypothetical protein
MLLCTDDTALDVQQQLILFYDWSIIAKFSFFHEELYQRSFKNW